jgi:aspartyl-tRNA(Asn)/glutamyl-tRNA(Gln) amidotransferase subunit B
METNMPTIGLEIHAELKTKTKMFCRSKNDPDEKRPNVNICPVCMAHPGTLPVINKEAVEHVLRVGLAAGGQVADYTEFDRKNYFYPDIPKGYQISQYKYPLVSGGEIAGVGLTRIHLEEDTAKSQHVGDSSLVDYNRAGVPLMELVTEPVIHSAKEAGDFARELQLMLRYLDVAEANMEKGEMRVEANISWNMGTKVEVKNLNSFRSVERAIDYELARQKEAIEKGEEIVQETRGWDEDKQVTFSQRKKESSHDYRYFPEPDLPKLKISEIEEFKNLAATIPELPQAKRERYAREYGIKAEDIEVFINSELYRTLFEVFTVPKLGGKAELIKLASNYITNDLVKLAEDDTQKVANIHDTFADLIIMVGAGEVSSRGAKDILITMVETGEGPKQIAEAKGLFQKSDEGALKLIVEEVMTANPQSVADYRAGKEAALMFLVGQGMKASKGSANPAVLKKLLQESIN